MMYKSCLSVTFFRLRYCAYQLSHYSAHYKLIKIRKPSMSQTGKLRSEARGLQDTYFAWRRRKNNMLLYAVTQTAIAFVSVPNHVESL